MATIHSALGVTRQGQGGFYPGPFQMRRRRLREVKLYLQLHSMSGPWGVWGENNPDSGSALTTTLPLFSYTNGRNTGHLGNSPALSPLPGQELSPMEPWLASRATKGTPTHLWATPVPWRDVPSQETLP